MYYEQLKNSLQVYKIPLLSLINRSRLHLLSLCVHIESNRSSIINLSVLLCIISSREPKTINREQRTRKKNEYWDLTRRLQISKQFVKMIVLTIENLSTKSWQKYYKINRYFRKKAWKWHTVLDAEDPCSSSRYL